MTQRMEHGRISDAALAELRSRIGVELRAYRYNEAATKDAIAHFCDGIGDDNPLYLDAAYASRSRYGGIIAPPCFLYSVRYAGGGGMGLPGVHGFHAGNDWDFYKMVHLNDRIQVKERLVDVVEKPSRYAGRIVVQYAETMYFNQRDDTVARTLSWSIRAERRSAREKGKYSEMKPAPYTVEQLRAIEADYEREEVRGATPRYWEDVNVGDELTPVVKGPLNMTDMMYFYAGVVGGGVFGRGGGAHRLGYLYRKRHRAWAATDESGMTIGTPQDVHLDTALAQEIGVMAPYDIGCQRICWTGHMLGNWMGDDGFLKKLHGELRIFNMFGDTTWIRGNVSKKQMDGSEHLVVIETAAVNQRGQTTAPGRATLALPSKSVAR
ncbi:MAG: MaoC family dehydratase N-terminal domain-containing protein [Chloroflexi bacterium]|nr:MaoC family dehydratase N-terminal domain-containing protein [Chloroflexota bacterium]